MISKPEKNRVEKILDSLKSASAGDYSKKIDFASENDELALIAAAVNTLLQKTTDRLSSDRQTSSHLTEDAGRYRHILDNIEESYFEVDLKGNLFFFNDTAIRDLGYRQEELHGINFHKLVDETNATKVYESFHQVFLTGRPIKGFDWQILKKNKEIIDVESSVSLLRDETGRPAGFRGIVRSISQRMQAQKELRQSEEKYRTILETMEEGYFESDLEGSITFTNDAGCRLHGRDRNEMIGMHYKQYSTPETAHRLYDVYSRIYKTRMPEFMLNCEVLHQDGKKRIHQHNAALLFDESGRPKGFRVLVRDVTEQVMAEDALRLSEKKYRNILEKMEEAYLETDLKGNFLFFNDSLCRVLGYSMDELWKANYRLIILPGQTRDLFKMFNEIYRTGQKRTLVDQAIMTKNGSIIYLEMSISLMRSPTGEPIGFNGISRDVTEKIKARQMIEESERHLRLITDNIRDIIWTMDFNLRWTYLSPSVLRITGFAPEEVIRMPLRAILPPETYARIKQILSEELSKEARGLVPDEQKMTTFEMPIMRKNGTRLWLEISANFNRDEYGKPFEIVGVTRDISERKKAEEALRESEKRYRMIVENMQDIIWTMDLNLQYKYRSPSNPRITGYTAEEIMAIHPRDLMTPESYARIEKILLEELANEQSGLTLDPNKLRTMELEVYRKDGSTAWIEVTATFNRNQNGEPYEILVAARDITARRKIEDALRESEKRYRTIIDNVRSGIALLDLNFKCLYVSPAEIRITGYTPEEIMLIPLQDQMLPESYSLVEKTFMEELEREFSDEPVDPDRSRTMELQVYHKNGGVIWLELTATFNRDEYGKPAGLIVSTHEITKRKKAQEDLKRSEQRYRMIVENMHEVIWTTDLNFRYTYVSPSCLWMTGYTPEEIVSMPFGQFLTPESLALSQTMIAEEMMREFSGKPADPYRSKTIEQELYHKNGGTIWMDVTSTFTRDENGKPVGMLAAAKDITARKKTEEEKGQLEAQLMQAQKMEIVGRLAGGVAHDFNNMLSVILGYVDLAKLRLARQHPVLNDIAEIEKAAIRSRDITTQLLAFSRKQIIEPKIIDLNELVSHTQKALIRLIGEDIELKFFQGENLWAILFDPSQIEQILINLAVNARDAMQGGGKLTIETANLILDALYCENHVGFTPGPYVRLSFSDNGIGMNKETVQHIFEPFFTTKAMGKGTGLGLATVYGIVKQNNCFINVYSEPDYGTTFSLYLPRASGERDIQDEYDDEPEITGRGNILLVEDDAMVLRITKGMLESIGYTVMFTDNPRIALSLCKNSATSVDLVITDVVMPVMSGKELRNKLVEIRPGLKVIFMSGYTADVIAHHGVLEEGVLFLQKPFTIKALAGKVAEAMALK